MTQNALFPNDDELNPPAKCPKCGMALRRASFLQAECVSCPYIWRRSSMLHHTEPLPYDDRAVEYTRRMTCPKCLQYGDGCMCESDAA